jgi:hypothetical protein
VAKKFTRETRYGLQPIREVCWRRGLTYNDFILQVGIRPLSHVRNAMIGDVPPSEELRHRAAFILGTPVEELFTAEALAAVREPGKIKGPRPRVGAR